MKSIKYLSRSLKKTKKNRNKSKKNRKSYRRRKGGMNTPAVYRADSTDTVAYGDNINASMQQPTENKSASFFSSKEGVGRSGLNLRNKFSNFTKTLAGVENTSNCNKEFFDRLPTTDKKRLRRICCRAKGSSPFCKYAKSITGEINGFDYNVSVFDNVYGPHSAKNTITRENMNFYKNKI